MAKKERYSDYNRKHTLKPRAKFDANWLPILQNLAALGLPAVDMGMILGHQGDCRQFIKNMQHNHPEADDAVQSGRELANAHLVAQAFRAACGYEYEEVKEEFDGDGELIKRTVTPKFMKPEPNLLMFLLCNRMEEEFKSVHKIEVNKNVNSVHANVEVTRNQIEELGGKLLEMAEQRKHVDSEVIDLDDHKT